MLNAIAHTYAKLIGNVCVCCLKEPKEYAKSMGGAEEVIKTIAKAHATLMHSPWNLKTKTRGYLPMPKNKSGTL